MIRPARPSAGCTAGRKSWPHRSLRSQPRRSTAPPRGASLSALTPQKGKALVPCKEEYIKENLRVGCRKLAIQRQSRLCRISSFLSQRAGKHSPKWREKRKQALRGAELIAKKKGGTKIKTCFIEIASHFEQRVLYCTDGSSNVFNLLTFSTL